MRKVDKKAFFNAFDQEFLLCKLTCYLSKPKHSLTEPRCVRMFVMTTVTIVREKRVINENFWSLYLLLMVNRSLVEVPHNEPCCAHE
jgi:hypothetical protein